MLLTYLHISGMSSERSAALELDGPDRLKIEENKQYSDQFKEY